VALDERLRRELEHAARPADPSGVYEELIRRKERRRVVRHVRQGVLAVAVVAGTIAGVVVLAGVFRVGERGVVVGSPSSPPPTTSAGPSPTPSPSPADERLTVLAPGVELCDATSVTGTFLGADPGSTAYVGTTPTGGSCDPPGRGIVAIDPSGDDAPVFTSGPFRCDAPCTAYAAPDVDGDGNDEILVQSIQFTVPGVILFDVVPNEDAPGLVRVMVEPPGDAILGFQGFDGSGPPQFWIGGDAFTADSLRCEPSDGGRVLVSVTAQEVPPDSPDAVWEVHETVFVLEAGVLRVIDARDFTVPVGPTPDFMRTGGCGADLRRP
jgi:hypothetical protein